MPLYYGVYIKHERFTLETRRFGVVPYKWPCDGGNYHTKAINRQTVAKYN